MEDKPRPFRNVGLFKDHFLLHRLSEMPECFRPSDDEVRAAYESVLAALDTFRKTYRRPNEGQTESELVEPVLNALGFAWVPQPDAKRQGKENWPDHALFADEDTKQAAAAYVGKDNH